MKTLVLVFQPNLQTSKVNARLLAELKDANLQDVTVRDEYALYPDFHVNAAVEQAELDKADRIIFQFPFYWYSCPALLREWEDRVIAAGWAYGGAHHLEGKELKLVVTTGSESAKYQKDGEYGRTMEELLSPFEVFAYKIGMRYEQPFLVQGVSTIDDTTLEQAAKEYVNAISQ